MNDRIDWNEWILQKNAESKAEELKKSESVILEKSNYGPKGGGQYSDKDNVKRKKGNVEKIPELGPNQNRKEWPTQSPVFKKPRAPKPSPAKIFTPEEIETYKKKKQSSI